MKKKKMSPLLRRLNYFSPIEHHSNNHSQTTSEDRDWENVYRNRWQYDKVVRSTHGVNCTGSCGWNIYVKNGIVTWEGQNLNYPSTGPDMPDFEPRGARGGQFFLVHLQPAPCEISICARCADQFVAGSIAGASKSAGCLEIDR